MISKTPFALASAAALAAATLASAGEPQAGAVTTTQSAYKVLVLDHEDAAAAGDEKHQIMVTSRAVNGAEPSMMVKVLGEGVDAETIDVGSLEPGETRTFETKDGKDVVVTRGEEGVTLSVDGKEIELPSLMNVSVLHGEPGAHAFAFASADGAIRTEDQDVVMVGMPPHVLLGNAALAGNFENLKSLEDVDPEVRQKVVEALHEILSGGAGVHAFSLTVPPGVEGDATASQDRVVVRRRAVQDRAESGSKME